MSGHTNIYSNRYHIGFQTVNLCDTRATCLKMCNSHLFILIKYVFIQYNTIQYNTIQYNTIQYNTIQYNTIQYNTIQYNTIQYNTIKLYCPEPGNSYDIYIYIYIYIYIVDVSNKECRYKKRPLKGNNAEICILAGTQ